MTKPRSWSVESHLDAIDAPPVPKTGKGRVVKVHRSAEAKDRRIRKAHGVTPYTAEEAEKILDALSWGFQ